MPYQAGPFDSAHLYLQWGGKLPGGEQWSCGLRMAPQGNSTSLDPQGMLAGVTTAVQAFHTNQSTCISSSAKLSFVKLNYINTSGHYAENQTFQSILADVAGGQATSADVPNQITLAVGLLTDVTRGPAHRGRFYIPLPVLGTLASGLIPTATATAIKGTAMTMVTALNAVNSNYKVAIFSRKLGSPAHRTVLATQVGRVPDTQRRRRRSLLEAYI